MQCIFSCWSDSQETLTWRNSLKFYYIFTGKPLQAPYSDTERRWVCGAGETPGVHVQRRSEHRTGPVVCVPQNCRESQDQRAGWWGSYCCCWRYTDGMSNLHKGSFLCPNIMLQLKIVPDVKFVNSSYCKLQLLLKLRIWACNDWYIAGI